jgi:hypothetical protein
LHDHDFRACKFFDERCTGGSVIVGVAGQQNLDIAEFESELFDGLANRGYRALEARVNEDVALGRGDQVTG